MSASVRPLIVLPADPEAMRIGGIASFVRGFVKFAPADFELGMIGVSAKRAPWRWHELELEGRRLRFLPILRAEGTRRSRLPLALRFGMAALRRSLDLAGWIPNLHRPGSEIVLRGHDAPAWRVVHLTREDLTTPGSESRWRLLPPLLGWTESRGFRRMDRIYVVNRAAVERYRRRYPRLAERFRYLPNWFDTRLFRLPDPAALGTRRAQVEARYGVPGGARILLYAGRLDGQKDPELLADAFAALLARRPGCVLLIAGEGALRDATERRLAASGALAATRFLGVLARDELAALMPTADCLLLTSRAETGPTVGYEALACGVPIVTSRVGQIATIVEEREAGRVVAERDPSAFAASVEAVLDRPRDEMQQRANRASAPYAAERVLGDLYDYQRELAARGRPS